MAQSYDWAEKTGVGILNGFSSSRLPSRALTVVIIIFMGGWFGLTDEARAQSMASSGNVSGWITGFLPDIGFPALSRMEITPYGKFGYRKVGWSAKLPVPFRIESGGSVDSVGDYYTLRLREVDLWVAELGMDAQLVKGVTVYSKISGNILQGILNEWFPESRTEAEQLLWRTRNFSWVELEGGIIKPIIWNFSMKAGLRYDDFRLAFKDPYEINASSVSGNTSVTLRAYQANSYIWIPYLGLGWNGKRLKLFLTGSLFAPSQIRLESRVSARTTSPDVFSCYTTFSSGEAASYIEMSLEYFMNWIPVVNLSFWGKSGWAQVSGKGDISYNCLPTQNNSTRVIDESRITFTRYDISAGLSLNATF